MSSTPTRRRRTFKSVASEEKKIIKLGLHERLEEHDLVMIHEAFEREDNKHLDQEQFRKLLLNVAKIDYEKEEFELLFKKINIRGTDFITWDELISHLILGFEEKEVSSEYKTLEAPISGIPRVLRSKHRHPVNRITYCPNVKANRTWNWDDGSIMTCSKDGVINYWSLDLQVERTVQSSCPKLRVQGTWVLDMVVMPDVSVVCTSSTERDLRFYDTSARKFELRIMITSLQDAVCAMFYRFSADLSSKSKLILGDTSGSVRILLFNPRGRGPFKSKPGIPLLHERYESLVKGRVEGFHLVEFKHIHSDWVRQVAYYPSLHSFVSCSSCQKVPLYLKDIGEHRCTYVYKVPKGVWCFALSDTQHIIATGGPDCVVRIWNPFVPDRPNITLIGHHTGIIALILQSDQILASMSKDKCIKVWDMTSQACLQTYLKLPVEIGERTDITFLYNPNSREIILGSVMIVVIHLCKLQSSEHTDGATHSDGVSVIIYNPLFKVLITCGLDSYVIVWDPWTGRRMRVIKDAHTRLLHGEIIPVEITSATFDPSYQFLLTGAHDGSLRLWNFNTGTCLRNINIERGCEISSIFWVRNRVLAAGWNRHVMEFAAGGEAAGPGGSFAKPWDTRHTEDILCAASRIPQSLATSTYNGELILWRLETGQPYKQYNVANPTTRITIQYKAMSRGAKHMDRVSHPATFADVTTSQRRRSRAASIFTRRQSIRQSILKSPASSGEMLLAGPLPARARTRKVSMVVVPETCVPLRGLAVHTMIFLSAREMHPDIGTLFVALENGTVQVWSHHASGGFVTSFSVIHKGGDYAVSMATDPDNEYLFIGTTAGYIKTWLMKSYCVLNEEHVCMPKYRLIFPFLWKDLFTGRAKRMCRGQPQPILLNSYKGHLLAVSGLVYLSEAKILISSSADCSVRMWTLGGRYLQTIGTFKPWKEIEVDVGPSDNFEYTIPPDIHRTASSTTFKVLMGGAVQRRLTKKQEQKQKEKDLVETDIAKGVYGKRLEEPILGNYYKLPERPRRHNDFELDNSFDYIPVYQHLITPALNETITTPKQRPSVYLGGDKRNNLDKNGSRLSLRLRRSRASLKSAGSRVSFVE